jgi:hypothetical protein
MRETIPEAFGFKPHDAQRPPWKSEARFKAIAAGRRSGKTVLAAADTVWRALRGGSSWRGWWVTPSHDIADTGFQLIEEAIADANIAERKLSPPREIHLTNGAEIGFRTTAGGANVSVGLDWVVIDEAAKGVPESAWIQELRPTLSDRNGEALFISTPDGKGWFFDWWQRGQDPDRPDVQSWRWSTYANPHVPDSEIDAARKELPERIFQQEYLAEFRDDTGGVFDVSDASEAYAPDAYAGEAPYRVGVDLARHEDYLGIVALDGRGRAAHLTRERGLTWPQVQSRVEQVHRQLGQPPVAVDATRDNKLVADLERAGVDVRPVTFSAQRKQSLIENLAAGLESGEVVVPADTILATELSVFEFTTTRAGNVRYGAPDGHHDDTVDALAMAYDLPAGGGVATARASFGDSDRGDDDTDGETWGDILPDPTA